MTPDTPAIPSRWLTAKQSSAYVQASEKLIYREVKAGRLRAARIGGRRDLRFLAEWLDAWLERSATPVEIGRR